MKLSEAFGLFGPATAGDADSKYSRYLPRLNDDWRVAVEQFDGARIESMDVREVSQWVTTIEDNDDLAHAIKSSGKRSLTSIESHLTMFITDARLVFIKQKKARRSVTVGHIRYPWVNAIRWRPQSGRMAKAALEVWMCEDFPVKHLGTWYHYIEIEFDGAVDTQAIALDLARRVCAHNLAHGAPEWAHEALRAQSQVSALPGFDEGGEGLWACPAYVACPLGAEYIGDSPPAAEWLGESSPSNESGTDDAPDVNDRQASAPSEPSALIFKRMLTRGRSVSRERGADATEPIDLLVALVFEDDTPVAQLLAKHGVNHRTVQGGWYRDRPVHVRVAADQASLNPQIALRWVRETAQLTAHRESGDHEEELESAERLAELGIDAKSSTARAYSEVALGNAYLALGRLSEAEIAYGCAKTLRQGSVTKVAALQPKLDPIKVLDDALLGMWQVAAKRGIDRAELLALENLRLFRAEHGLTDSEGWMAHRFARASIATNDYAAAAWWAGLARTELTGPGQTRDYASATQLELQSAIGLKDSRRAITLAGEAVHAAQITEDPALIAAARYEKARAVALDGDEATAWSEFVGLLPYARQTTSGRARTILIQLAKINPVHAAPIARELARGDAAFFGPQAAEIALEGAQKLLPDHAEDANALLVQAVQIIADVLTHPNTVGDNIDRAYETLSSVFATSNDRRFVDWAASELIGPIRRLDTQRLQRRSCRQFLSSLRSAHLRNARRRLTLQVVEALTERSEFAAASAVLDDVAPAGWVTEARAALDAATLD